LSLFDRLPHMSEHRRRHVRMPHEVVRLADQFLARETAYLDECIVAVGDLAVEVSGGNQAVFGRKGSFSLSHGQVLAHRVVPVGIGMEAGVLSTSTRPGLGLSALFNRKATLLQL